MLQCSLPILSANPKVCPYLDCTRDNDLSDNAGQHFLGHKARCWSLMVNAGIRKGSPHCEKIFLAFVLGKVTTLTCYSNWGNDKKVDIKELIEIWVRHSVKAISNTPASHLGTKQKSIAT